MLAAALAVAAESYMRPPLLPAPPPRRMLPLRNRPLGRPIRTRLWPRPQQLRSDDTLRLIQTDSWRYRGEPQWLIIFRRAVIQVKRSVWNRPSSHGVHSAWPPA